MIVSMHLYSASYSAHQSEALPVRETQREESSFERTKKRGMKKLKHRWLSGCSRCSNDMLLVSHVFFNIIATTARYTEIAARNRSNYNRISCTRLRNTIKFTYIIRFVICGA